MTTTLEKIQCPICQEHAPYEPVPGSRMDHHIKKLGLGTTVSQWAICKKCTLVYQNPRPNDETYNLLYEGSVYHEHHMTDDQIQKSVELVGYCFDEKIDFVEKFVSKEDYRKGRVLDIGCGMGGALAVFKRRGYEVYGVQPDPELTKIAQDRFGIETKNGYYKEDVFPENHFAIVFTNHAFEHFDDPAAVAKGIAKNLKPGGVCFTCIPTYAKNKTWIAKDWMGITHNWIFTHETLGALFEIEGLKPKGFTYSGTSKYTDEMWLVVEKPLNGLNKPTRSDVLSKMPKWNKAKWTLRYGITLRAVAYLPWVFFQKIKKFFYITGGGNPKKVLMYLKQVFQSRFKEVRLFFSSFYQS